MFGALASLSLDGSGVPVVKESCKIAGIGSGAGGLEDSAKHSECYFTHAIQGSKSAIICSTRVYGSQD